MLKYAHEKGCPWDEDTCRYAAEEHHLEVLKYARENGCPEDRTFEGQLLMQLVLEREGLEML